MKKNFKLGHIIYGLSVDTSLALEALSNIGFHRRENRKDNILVQNSLTNAVFGLVPLQAYGGQMMRFKEL